MLIIRTFAVGENGRTVTMAEKWGIWNSIKKGFQFGISEDTPEKARKRLFQKIGKDAYKWRFEVKRMRGDGNG